MTLVFIFTGLEVFGGYFSKLPTGEEVLERILLKTWLAVSGVPSDWIAILSVNDVSPLQVSPPKRL